MVTPGAPACVAPRRSDLPRTGHHFPTPWHFLYFLPEPHGQGSFRPTSGTAAVARARGPSELLNAGSGERRGAALGAGPLKRSSAPVEAAEPESVPAAADDEPAAPGAAAPRPPGS